MGISWPTVQVAVFSQIVVALITVRLALGRFRQERWWERKYEAYSEMLTSLHQLRRSYEDDID
jgi:ABC-type arginine transport system permease subunit